MTALETHTKETTERTETTEAAQTHDNPLRGRGNAAFFVTLDRYINWIARPAKEKAFGGLAGPTICEIGPGVGANLRYYPAGVRMIAVEPNVHMHRALRRRTAEHGVDLDLHACTAERMPLADSSVDEVVSSLVLCTVDDPAAVLGEVRRVLRPGGRFRFVEHVVAHTGSVRRGVQRLLHRPWAWCFEGCKLDRDTGAMLAAAGFSDLDHEQGWFRRSVFYPVNRAVWGVATR